MNCDIVFHISVHIFNPHSCTISTEKTQIKIIKIGFKNMM